MFLATITAAIFIGGDERPVKQSAPPAQRFDLKRTVQWMFGKPASAPKPTPLAAAAKDDDLSDSRIEHRCRTNVYSDPAVRSSGVKIRVADGVAYLDGGVEDRWQRVRAEQLALRTPGVVRVENNLRTNDLDTAPDRQPTADFAPSVLELATATATAPGSVVSSRPKTLPNELGEPVVTTYTIRRAATGGEKLQPAAAVEKTRRADAPKPKSGKLVPWKNQASTNDWLEAIGFSNPPSMAKALPTGVHNDPLDRQINSLIAEGANAKNIAFERKGGDVVLKGAAPPKVLLTLAQQIGSLPGVATVSIETEAGKATSNP